MGGYLKFFICFMCILSIYGQRIDKPIICWNSQWFNHFSPTETNRSDYEHQSAKVLDSICTTGSPIAAQCKDQKGEPFSGYKNDTVSKFIATCNVALGLICNPYNTTKNETCPDYQIQYGCTCPKTTTHRPGSGGKAAVTPRGGAMQANTGVSTLKNGSGSGGVSGGGSGNSGSQNTGSGSGLSTPGQQHGQGGNSGQNYGFSQIVLLSCIILAIFC